MRREEIVIIGAGPAGCASAVQCKRLGIGPLLLDRTGRAGGLTANAFSIENYPGLPPTEGPVFARRLAAHLRRFGISVEQSTVEQVTPMEDGFLVKCHREGIRARAVIVCVGTRPNTFALEGAEDLEENGLHYEVRDLCDARQVKRALVAGGGEAAFDYALSLASAGASVKLCVRGQSPRARGRLVELVAGCAPIELLLGTRCIAVARDGDSIEVELEGKSRRWTETVDGVVAAVGRASRVPEITGALDVNPIKGVSTRLRGLYVAGDARTGSLGQAGMAVGDGLAAAMTAVEFLTDNGAQGVE